MREEERFKEQLESAQAPPPPEEVTYRKINRQTSKRTEKRGWGQTTRSNSNDGQKDFMLSSQSLRDSMFQQWFHEGGEGGEEKAESRYAHAGTVSLLKLADNLEPALGFFAVSSG